MAIKKRTTRAKTTNKTTRKTTKGKNTVRATSAGEGKHLDGYQWGRIMAKAWSDPEFKRQVEEDPTTTIRKFLGKEANGVNIFHIPPKPPDVDENQLTDIVKGKQQMYHCSHLC